MDVWELIFYPRNTKYEIENASFSFIYCARIYCGHFHFPICGNSLQFIVSIANICDLLGCTGNPRFHAIHCAQSTGACRNTHNATIYCVIFIAPEFIANATSTQMSIIATIYFIYCGYCDLLGCAGNVQFHAIYCVPFIGASTYPHNATIYCAIFI